MRPNKRDELVSKALKVFYRDGFHATGMDKLVARPFSQTMRMVRAGRNPI